MPFHTAADTKREAQTRAELEAKWGVVLEPTEAFAHADFLVVPSGQAIEVKWRAISSYQYRTVFLALRKYHNLLAFPDPIFVVYFTDLAKWIRVAPCVIYPIVMGGHNNPRAEMDRELMIEVPIADMQPLTVSPW